LKYSQELIDKNIQVAGWIRTVRKLGQGQYLFLELNDGSTVKHLQVIILNKFKFFQEILNEGIGACVFLKGRMVKSVGNKQDVNRCLK
jgi:asparaginyl-tRNA synthetase